MFGRIMQMRVSPRRRGESLSNKEAKKMNITKLTDSELADLTANLVGLLAGTELSAIEPGLRTELVTAFGTMPADFASELSDQAVANDDRKAATSTKDKTRDDLLFVTRRTQYALKAGGAPKSQFDLARFDYPAPRSAQYIAQTPTEMFAVGFSNGINTGGFRGNNRRGMVMYEVWRREGDEGPWHIHILTTKQRFKDEGVTPGQYYEYRVRAKASQNVSDFSNSTVVYGVL